MTEGSTQAQAADGESKLIFKGPASVVALIGPAVNCICWLVVASLLFSARPITERIGKRMEGSTWAGSLTSQVARVSEALKPAVSNLATAVTEVRDTLAPDAAGGTNIATPPANTKPAPGTPMDFSLSGILFLGLKLLGWLFILSALLRLCKAVWRWLSTRYLLTTHRIEIERGIFSKRILNLELWRVKDICYSRSFWDFFFRVGRLNVIAVDEQLPALSIGPIPNARNVYDQLKQARLLAGQRAGAQAMGVAG